MGYLTASLGATVYALAIWDEEWKAHNNCYLLETDGGLTLIDCGKEQHGSHLLEALSALGYRPEDVRHLIATHGHADHVGAADQFPRAVKWIHPADLDRLSPARQAQFDHHLPDEGRILGLQCVHLGQHTAGSVALFHPPSGVLFCGDHICFFGGDLPPEGLVGPAPDRRERWRNLVVQFVDDAAAREKYQFDRFVGGLKLLRRYPAQFLASGHGVVLVGEIDDFLASLLEAASS